MISVLNSISSLNAENALSSTQASLQKTFQQLSTGLKINSGSDDAAGLSIANGLGANISALTQSSQNASNGIGLLQTADGALSQVTTLLNRAVTLATEAANGGITANQYQALNTEFTSIKNEIDQIGTTTNFNGTQVFANNSTDSFTSSQGSTALPLAAGTALVQGSVTTIADAKTGKTFTFTAGAADTVSTLTAAITTAAGAGTLGSGTGLNIVGGKAVITGGVGDSITVASNDATLGAFAPTSSGTANSSTVFTSDGTATGSNTLTTAINNLSSAVLGLGSNDLTSGSDASAALTNITAAISTVSASRGNLGASINQLTADTNVENTEVTNLTSAQNSIQNADIGATVAKMTQYNVLEQTGMAALSQSNQAQQSVLKLLQ